MKRFPPRLDADRSVVVSRGALVRAVPGNAARWVAVMVALAIFGASATLRADDESADSPTWLALTNATLHPVASASVKNGTLLIRDGKIDSIGADLTVPEQAEQIDFSGKQIFPAMIDTDTSIGLVEIEAVRATVDTVEMGTMNPNVESIIAFNPDSELIPVARADGVLVALTRPRGGFISGQSSILQLEGWNWQDMVLLRGNGMHVNWPWPMTAPTDGHDTKPAKRAERIQSLEDECLAARAYRALCQEDETAPFDSRLDALARVTCDGMPLYIHADELQQIEEAVAFCIRMQLKLVIVGGYDAPHCAELLKKHDVPVIVTGTHRLPQNRHRPYDEAYRVPALLYDAGVRFCLAGFDRFSASAVRNLPQHAGTAAAFGLPREAAVRAITLDAAEIVGVGDRVGSLEPGKDATFIVTQGDLLEVTTRVERAWIAGNECDLDSRHKRLYRKYRKKYVPKEEK